jgi:hypothetical protein
MVIEAPLPLMAGARTFASSVLMPFWARLSSVMQIDIDTTGHGLL